MITKFKLYEGSDWKEHYIVAVPSGEVIYISLSDLDMLRKQNFVFFDSNRGDKSLYRYVCNDVFINKVKDAISNTDKSAKQDIIRFLMDDCGLLKDQFRIFDDMSVDAMGPVNMSYKGLKRIPVKFNRCTSDFNCSYNKLISLVNTPRTVHGKFDCSYNKLPTLLGGPRLVSKLYNCSHNSLVSLEGAPLTSKDFNCSHNLLNNMDKAPKINGNLIKNDNVFNAKEV